MTSTGWPAYEHGSYHRSTSSGDPAITTATAATVHPAWTFTAPRSDGKSVWVSTGNPASSASQVYDACSVVRLDAATFTKQDKWTGSFPLGADLDSGSSPTLFAANLNGTATTMVGACNKNGVYYAWASPCSTPPTAPCSRRSAPPEASSRRVGRTTMRVPG